MSSEAVTSSRGPEIPVSAVVRRLLSEDIVPQVDAFVACLIKQIRLFVSQF